LREDLLKKLTVEKRERRSGGRNEKRRVRVRSRARELCCDPLDPL